MDKAQYIKTLEEIREKLQLLINDLEKHPGEDGNLRILLGYQRLDTERILKYLRIGPAMKKQDR